jgi:hypothetical protein
MPKKRLDPNRPRRWQAILRRIPDGVEWHGAEVGVWMGRTAMEVLKARPLLTWYMIDPWQAPDAKSEYAQSPDSIAKNQQPYFEECYAKTLQAIKPWAEQAVMMRMYSEDAASKFEDRSLDCVFIDAIHTYDAVRTDIALWLPKVRVGGWIGGHDYGNEPRFPGVRLAVDEVFGDDKETDGDCTYFHRVRGDEL